MPLNAEKLLALQIPEVEHTYGPKDCILYALGLGLGHEPLNRDELAFVYEKNLKVLPTFAVMLGYAAYWLRLPEIGVTWEKVVHGEHGMTLHAPIAPQGTVIGRTRILDVVDKGEGKGALIYSQRDIFDKASGRLLVTLKQTTFCRGDGGFGGAKRDTPAPHALPLRAPDGVVDFATRPEMALIYRLSGDTNALHVDPDFAKAAGFPRPVLHGLATFGVAGHALLKAVCGYDPARLDRHGRTLFGAGLSGRDHPHRVLARRQRGKLPRAGHGTRRGGDRPWPRRGDGMSKRSAHTDDHADIRESVRALCAKFPGEYWRALDRERAYPTEFVRALTEAGYLAALIPEEFGGSGLGISAACAILEEVHASGGNGAACHAQMYTMGTILRHGSAAQKQAYLPKIASGELRLQAFGVTEPTSGTDTLSLRTTARREGNDHYVINGQKIWTSRAEHSDLMLLLARTTPKEQNQDAHRRPVGVPGRHASRAIGQPHHQSDPHHDEPRHHRRCSSTTCACRRTI